MAVVEIPEIRYARSADGIHVAYQTVGDGPPDIVFSSEWISHCEVQWEHPIVVSALHRLATFGRVISFDKRGIGLSDPVSTPEVPSLETWVDDLRSVLDALGSERAVLAGMGHGGQLAMLFAATYPQRVGGLVLLNAYARLSRAADYPFGYPKAVSDLVCDGVEDSWGTASWALDALGPSVAADDTVRQWWNRMERMACSPGVAVAMQRAMFEQDVRNVLPLIQAPTLVLQVSGDHHVRVGHGRYLAEHIAGAHYLELPGDDHWFFVGSSAEPVFEAFGAFVGAMPEAVETDRVLATLLFSDVVGSTPLADELGDRKWHELLDRLDYLVERQVERFRGHVVKAIGDGHLVRFDGPGRAIRCAQLLMDGAHSLGITLRVGIHTGEVELRGDDVAGIAVHIAERVQATAQPDELLVSSTVKDLVAGSDLRFQDQGEHYLKGVPNPWRVFSVKA